MSAFHGAENYRCEDCGARRFECDYTVPHKMKTNMKHTNLIDDIMTEQPKDHSNLYVGIAVGVMIVAGAGILVFGLVAEVMIK